MVAHPAGKVYAALAWLYDMDRDGRRSSPYTGEDRLGAAIKLLEQHAKELDADKEQP